MGLGWIIINSICHLWTCSPEQSLMLLRQWNCGAPRSNGHRTTIDKNSSNTIIFNIQSHPAATNLHDTINTVSSSHLAKILFKQFDFDFFLSVESSLQSNHVHKVTTNWKLLVSIKVDHRNCQVFDILISQVYDQRWSVWFQWERKNRLKQKK